MKLFLLHLWWELLSSSRFFRLNRNFLMAIESFIIIVENLSTIMRGVILLFSYSWLSCLYSLF